MALVTPASIKNTADNSLTYVAKFREYDGNPNCIVSDLEASGLEQRNRSDWVYPLNIEERVKTLSLSWHTYNELFSDFPDSAIRGPLEEFWAKFGE